MAYFNDAFGDKAIDLRVLIADFTQHFARVFAEQWRRALDRGRRFRKMQRAAECLGRPGARRIGLAGAYDFLPIENPDVKPVFFHPNSPPESQPIRYVSASVPRTFLAAAPEDNLINPERNTRQMATKLQAAGVPVTLQFYPARITLR